jgi:hypothetical protein
LIDEEVLVRERRVNFIGMDGAPDRYNFSYKGPSSYGRIGGSRSLLSGYRYGARDEGHPEPESIRSIHGDLPTLRSSKLVRSFVSSRLDPDWQNLPSHYAGISKIVPAQVVEKGPFLLVHRIYL